MVLSNVLFAQYLPTPQVPWYSYLLNIIVLVAGLFLILLVLIQRGKGGGLAGAFGGAGGSSAFGSRAGDQFTKITLGVAGVWILLTMIQVRVVQGTNADQRVSDVPAASAPAEPTGTSTPVDAAPAAPPSPNPEAPPTPPAPAK